MSLLKHSAAGSDLVKAVRSWMQLEEEDREQKSRVAAALDGIKEFIGKYQSDLERRKSRILQTGGFKDETRSMEAALANIQQLVASGKNISRIFFAIDTFLDTYKVVDTFAKEHVRTQLADARDDFMCAFQDSIRGTRLAELLGILFFMPYSYWRSRGVETRNFRSPSAAEVLKLLEELGQAGVAVNGIGTVQLAAIIRMKLGITPRMDYHRMSANKLAELLTSEETISRFTSRSMPLDEGFCRIADGILANIRRWSTECFGSAYVPAPSEIEAEMVQIVCLATENIRISGTESERSADFLWLLSTVIASDHKALKDILAGLSDKNSRNKSVHERMTAAKNYVDEIAVKIDWLLLSRWSEARKELASLTVRTDAIASKSTRVYGEYTELEMLKEKRSDVVKSMIKISDSMQCVESSLLSMLTSQSAPCVGPSANEYLRALDPAELRNRNYMNSEETKKIARQELEKLRQLIGRITQISRISVADPVSQSAQERLRAQVKLSRKTSDGVEIGKIPSADVHEKLRDSLWKAALSAREFKGKVEGARRRILKSEIQHALNVLCDKMKRAVEICGSFELDTTDPACAAHGSDSIVPLLREIMTAQANVSTRVNNVALTPAEKQLLKALMGAIKMRLGDDLRDIELVRAELVERSAASETSPQDDTKHEEIDGTVAREAVAHDAEVSQDSTSEAVMPAQEDVRKASAAKKMADLAAAANSALKPVKDLIVELSNTISARTHDSQAILDATNALKRAIIDAQDVMTVNFARIKAIAAELTMTTDEYVEKYDRWHGQIIALERETERLLRAMAAVATGENVVKNAAALEKGISETLKPPSASSVRAEPFVPLRERCVSALETIAPNLIQLREARETLASATKAEWKILKTAPEYLMSRRPDLAGFETELKAIHTRIEKTHNQFKSDRPRRS